MESMNLFLKVSKDFLKSRKQNFKWSIFGLELCSCRCSKRIFSWPYFVLLLIYINDLSDGLKRSPKLFAGDTSSFAAVLNINEVTNDLHNDLIKITKWTF